MRLLHLVLIKYRHRSSDGVICITRPITQMLNFVSFWTFWLVFYLTNSHPGILNIRWILHFQVWRSRSGDANERLQLWRKSAKQEKCKTAVCTVAKKFRYAPIDSQYFVLTRSTFAESVKKCSRSSGAMPGGAIFDCVSRCCNWPYFLESVSKTSEYGWKLDGVRHSMSPKFQDSLYKDRFCRAGILAVLCLFCVQRASRAVSDRQSPTVGPGKDFQKKRTPVLNRL